MNLSEIIAKYDYRFPGPRTIETAEGWSKLIENFLGELELLDQKLRVTIFCIKEKFGTLCIQTENVQDDISEHVNKLIHKYEFLSRSVCEICGRKGEMVKKGYMMTRCWICEK